MEKSNPYSFFFVLADGVMEIPQDSNLSWITLFYALPKELVEKRPAYLELPAAVPDGQRFGAAMAQLPALRQSGG